MNGLLGRQELDVWADTWFKSSQYRYIQCTVHGPNGQTNSSNRDTWYNNFGWTVQLDLVRVRKLSGYSYLLLSRTYLLLSLTKIRRRQTPILSLPAVGVPFFLALARIGHTRGIFIEIFLTDWSDRLGCTASDRSLQASRWINAFLTAMRTDLALRVILRVSGSKYLRSYGTSGQSLCQQNLR